MARGRPKAELPPAEVLYLEHRAGKSYHEMSKKYGVCKATIGNRISSYKKKLAGKKKEAGNRLIVSDEHCRGCGFAHRVGHRLEEHKHAFRERQVVFCPFIRCIKHHGFTAEKREKRKGVS